jgi:hypothetical protein
MSNEPENQRTRKARQWRKPSHVTQLHDRREKSDRWKWLRKVLAVRGR